MTENCKHENVSSAFGFHSWFHLTEFLVLRLKHFLMNSLFFCVIIKGFDGEPPILLKEEPEDGSRSFQKVPSLSDLSEESEGEYR